MTKVRPVFRKWLRILLPPIVVVFGVILWGDVEARRYEQAVALVEARVPKIPPPSAEEDGARFYAAAAVLSDVPTLFPVAQAVGAMRDALVGETAIELAVADAAHSTLRVNEPTLAAVDRASEMELGPIRWQFQVLRSVPVWSAVTPVMSLRTLDDISRGNCDHAVQSLTSAVRFLRGATADTQSYAATQQANVSRGLVADLAVLLQRCDVPAAALEQIDQAFGSLIRPGDLQRLILGQARFRYSNIALYCPGEILCDVIRPARYRVAAAIARSAMEALAVADKPWPQRVRDMSSLSTWHVWLAPKALRVIDGEANRSLFEGLTQNFASGVAGINAARTAIAIERYRRINGRLPNLLTELAMPPDTSLDPFTGASLVYRIRDNGYVLYSVGRNGHDDGGDMGPATKAVVPGALGKDVGIVVGGRRLRGER